MDRLDTVVLPVAGSGTRMRPATEAVAKELLPVYDTPLLQFGLEEAVTAGARRIVLVTSAKKPGIRAYIDRLTEKADPILGDAEVVCVDQDKPLGLGHAVLCARQAALPGPVGVILPDDLIAGPSCLKEMCAAFDPGSMNCLIAAQVVKRSEVNSYGIFDTAAPDSISRVTPAHGLVEKPDPDAAPSTLAAVGRYVISPDIWDILARTEPGAGDEVQLTDAIAELGGLYAFRFSGQRYDCGSKEGLFAATQAYRESRADAAVGKIAAE